MTVDDRGAAALAERLRLAEQTSADSQGVVGPAYVGPPPEWYFGYAVAILGERGRFLPDGLPLVNGRYDRLADIELLRNDVAHLRRIVAAAPAALEQVERLTAIIEGRADVFLIAPHGQTSAASRAAGAALRAALESETPSAPARSIPIEEAEGYHPSAEAAAYYREQDEGRQE